MERVVFAFTLALVLLGFLAASTGSTVPSGEVLEHCASVDPNGGGGACGPNGG